MQEEEIIKNKGKEVFDSSKDRLGNIETHFEKTKIKKSFIVGCLKGGLNSYQQILEAYSWALRNKYVENDKYININYNNFAKKISEIFKTTYHSDWKIRSSKEGHTWITNSKYKIIFDSADPNKSFPF